MKKYLKRLAVVGIILYMAQAMVGIYYGIQLGIHISNQMNQEGK